MNFGLSLFLGAVIALAAGKLFLFTAQLSIDPRFEDTPRRSFPELHKRVRLWAALGFSFLVLVSALYIIIFTKEAESQKWAFGAVGLILGFWLK